MKDRQKKHFIIWALGYSFLLLILQSIIYLLVQNFTTNTIFVNLFTYLISCILLVIIFYKTILIDIKNVKQDAKEHLKEIIISFVLFILLEVITNYIISNYFNSIALNEQVNIINLLSNPLISSIYLILLGPISEELIIKLPFKLANNNKLISFIVITLYFAILHIVGSTDIQSLLYFIPYLFLSLSINYSYYKTDNICISIILHIINNILGIILTLTV